MKISTIKRFGAIAVAGALLSSLVFVLAACGSGGDSGTQSESNPSSTVSIYYKDDASSEIYDDIISDGSDTSSGGNLANDAKPELSVPTGKPSQTSSTAETSSKPSETSSKPSSSAQQGAASSETPPASSSSQTASTSSQDKGYTKPY